MTVTFATTEALWRQLASLLGDTRETAALVSGRVARDGFNLILLARSVVLLDEDHYVVRHSHGLGIRSQAYVPFLKQVMERDEVFIFFHTHPGGDPGFSSWDNEVDRELAALVQTRNGTGIYGSVVLGGTTTRPGFGGRVFVDEVESPIDHVRIVGSHLTILDTSSEDLATPFTHDRQIRAFGRTGQAILHSLRVGVVGAGGTGSAVCEQLIRLGVGTVIVADNDTVTSTNISRIYGSGVSTVGKPKVDVVVDNAKRIGLRTEVIPVNGRVNDRTVAERFRFCDVIFGCTDDNAGRSVLSRLAYWYLIPTFDMAVLIESQDSRVTGIFGRVSTVQVGTPCLVCRGRIDSGLAAAEVLSPEERSRLAGEGYVPGLGEPDPSVVTFTSLVASVALSEFLDRLFEFGRPNPPSELLLRIHDRAISTTSPACVDGHFCGDRDNWGAADSKPFLGQLWPE